jgi:hypothetical protein
MNNPVLGDQDKPRNFSWRIGYAWGKVYTVRHVAAKGLNGESSGYAGVVRKEVVHL